MHAGERVVSQSAGWISQVKIVVRGIELLMQGEREVTVRINQAKAPSGAGIM